MAEPLNLNPGDPVTVVCMCGRRFRVNVGDTFVAEQTSYGTCTCHHLGPPQTGNPPELEATS